MQALVIAGFSAAVLALCAAAWPLGRLLGVIDHPDGGRKAHGAPTPLVGGLALVLPLAAGALAHIVLSPAHETLFTVLAIGSAGFFLLGFVDDRRPLPPAPRLVLATVLAALLLVLEPSLTLRRLELDPPFGVVALGLLALPFTLLCIVGLQNAVNMADGRNGLVLALTIFWLICLLVHAPPHLQLYLGLFLLGALIVLPYNWGGRLFLGDAGSHAIGGLMAMLMLHVHASGDGRPGALSVALWVLVPILDCLRLIVERTLDGRSPLSADTNHLHHHLERLWPWPKALAAYMALVALPAALDLALPPEATVPLVLLTALAYGMLLHRTRRATHATPAE